MAVPAVGTFVEVTEVDTFGTDWQPEHLIGKVGVVVGESGDKPIVILPFPAAGAYPNSAWLIDEWEVVDVPKVERGDRILAVHVPGWTTEVGDDSDPALRVVGSRYAVCTDTLSRRDALRPYARYSGAPEYALYALTWVPLARTPEVGETVIALKVPLYPDYDGKPCKVTDVTVKPDQPNGIVISGEFESRQKPDDTISLSFNFYEYPTTVSKDAVPVDSAARIAELVAEVEMLKSEKDTLETRLSNALRDVEHGRRTVRLIGERLLQEAEERDWCSQYDEVIDSLNSQIPAGWELPDREKDWTVRWQEEVTVTVTRSWSGQARDEDSAMERARYYFDSLLSPNRGDIEEALRNGDYDCADEILEDSMEAELD